MIIEKIRKGYLRYGIKKTIKKILVTIIPTKSIFLLRGLKESYDTYNKLYKKYAGKIKIYASDKEVPEPNKAIYSAWFQGEEWAPKIVRACWESVRRNLPGYQLMIITNENYSDYVEIDSNVVKKYELGVIGATHFSDIIRTKVLIDYGGIWIDSTVLCTGSKLIEYLCGNNVDLFVYQNYMRDDLASVLSNWFIYAGKNNVILRSTYDLLIEYWKNNNELVDYFLYHMLFTIVVKKYPDEWENVPIIPNAEPQLMQKELFQHFDADRYDMLCSLSSFHKLTYKFNERQEEMMNTTYQYIINQFI